jgi:hypothetical protein
MYTRDGLQLTGGSPEEVIADLHRKSFTQEANDREFMLEVQRRTLQQTGKRVRVRDAESFIEDLRELGLLVDEAAPDKLPVKE